MDFDPDTVPIDNSGTVRGIAAYWTAFPGLKNALFSFENSAYASLKVEDVKKTVASHPDVLAFIQHYVSAFNGFDSYLSQELIPAYHPRIRKPGRRFGNEVIIKSKLKTTLSLMQFAHADEG